MDQFSTDNAKVTKHKQDYKLYSFSLLHHHVFQLMVNHHLALQTLVGEDYKHSITQEINGRKGRHHSCLSKFNRCNTFE